MPSQYCKVNVFIKWYFIKGGCGIETFSFFDYFVRFHVMHIFNAWAYFINDMACFWFAVSIAM